MRASGCEYTALSVHAYEIPNRISDHVNLRYPVEQFPYGTTETRTTPAGAGSEGVPTDLDHIQPYREGESAAQTSTGNLAPQGRFGHRLKTFGNWRVRRVDDYTLEWTTEHGYQFHVDHTGTHRVPPSDQDRNQHRGRDRDPRRPGGWHHPGGQTSDDAN